MEVSELIKKVRKLELKTKKQSSELFAGNYRSNFKGRGMSFSEVRAYHFGDDIRAIDWNVTARNQEPYIKEFEEERELTFLLLIDISQSTLFGTNQTQKKDIIAEIAATIAFSALQNNDKVGVLFFAERVIKYIPPKKGKGHVLTILRDLIHLETDQKGTNIAEALHFLQNSQKKKSVVFLLSDFIESPDYTKEINIASRRHQFYAIQVYDKAEFDLPPLGLVQLYNAERGQSQWVDTSNAKFRHDLAKDFESNMMKHKNKFERLGDTFVSLHIQEAYLPKLARVFNK